MKFKCGNSKSLLVFGTKRHQRIFTAIGARRVGTRCKRAPVGLFSSQKKEQHHFHNIAVLFNRVVNVTTYFHKVSRHSLQTSSSWGEILQRADGFLKIPMVPFTESLNISVSAAIIIQNLTSRLLSSNIDGHLSENEILEKRLAWAKNSIKDVKRIEERYFEENPKKS